MVDRQSKVLEQLTSQLGDLLQVFVVLMQHQQVVQINDETATNLSQETHQWLEKFGKHSGKHVRRSCPPIEMIGVDGLSEWGPGDRHLSSPSSPSSPETVEGLGADGVEML